MKRAVYPGSFDPITFGHLDIIERSAKMVDELVIGVLCNSAKNSLFSLEERVNMIKEITKDIPNVRVESFGGLLVDYMKQIDANIIQPRIIADSVGLKPLYVLLAIMVGGGLFGFVGILVSVPVMAVIKMIIVDYIKNLNGKDTPLVQKQKELASESKE